MKIKVFYKSGNTHFIVVNNGITFREFVNSLHDWEKGIICLDDTTIKLSEVEHMDEIKEESQK